MTPAEARALRDAMDLTQAELASLLDLSKRTVERAESGPVSRLYALALERVADLHGVAV